MARALAWLGGHTAKLHGDAGWVARSDAGHPRSQGVWEKSPLVGLEQSAKILGHLMGPAIDRKSQKWRRSDRICPSAAFAGTASFRQACQIQTALRIIESAQSKAQLKEIEAGEVDMWPVGT